MSGTTWAHFVNTRLVLQYTDTHEDDGTNIRQVSYPRSVSLKCVFVIIYSLSLSLKLNEFQLLVVKSPLAPFSSFDYKITSAGISFIG